LVDRLTGLLRRVGERLPPWAKGRAGKVALTALLLLPAVGIIAYRTWKNWGQLMASPPVLRPVFWIPALVGYTLAVLCALWIWNRLMVVLANFRHAGQNARIYCLANLPKHIPTPIWYMASRGYLYSQVGVPPSLTLAATALEITLLVASGLTTYLLTMLLAGPGSVVPLQLGLALLLLAVAVALLQPPVFNRILALVLRRVGSTAQVHIAYRDLGPLLLAGLLAWGIGGITLSFVAQSVYPIPWAQVPTVIGYWAASSTVGILASVFIMGLGVREVALSVLLAALMPQPLAVAVAVLFWFLLTGGDLATAGIAALLSRRSAKAPEPGTGAADGAEERPPQGSS
jgi:hypothetical protein